MKRPFQRTTGPQAQFFEKLSKIVSAFVNEAILRNFRHETYETLSNYDFFSSDFSNNGYEKSYRNI